MCLTVLYGFAQPAWVLRPSFAACQPGIALELVLVMQTLSCACQCLKGGMMEEWHQKLHNNTTPDDVPICEAYLAYLQADGNVSAYWRTLSDAGITRERLESFDRPITLVGGW